MSKFTAVIIDWDDSGRNIALDPHAFDTEQEAFTFVLNYPVWKLYREDGALIHTSHDRVPVQLPPVIEIVEEIPAQRSVSAEEDVDAVADIVPPTSVVDVLPVTEESSIVAEEVVTSRDPLVPAAENVQYIELNQFHPKEVSDG